MKRKLKRPNAQMELPNPAPPVVHKVEGKAVVGGLYKARVPARFCRKEVKLAVFPWGERMSRWLDTLVPEARAAGQCLTLSTAPEDAMVASAMLVRSLVIRGHDAVFLTLEELLAGEEEVRQSEFLVVAGFYDLAFNKKHGSPMTTPEAFKLSWRLWRMASEGTTIIVQCSPSSSGMSDWWHLGALKALFNTSNSLTL